MCSEKFRCTFFYGYLLNLKTQFCVTIDIKQALLLLKYLFLLKPVVK